MPKILKFKPVKEIEEFSEDSENIIALTIDEYEVIRLIDYENLNQEEAAILMGVARTTVQAIYKEGRKKLARFLIEGKDMEIRGGSYKLSFGQEFCKHKNCHLFEKVCINNKGMVDRMKIIIPVNENKKDTKIADNLGRANFYAIYDLEKDSFEFVENGAKLNTGGAGIAAAQTLVDTGSRILLTPRCGMKAGKVLDASGFKVYKTISDDLNENINKYKAGELTILEERGPGKHGDN